MREVTTAVIFAGGRSSRMGEDKALLPFANYPTLTEFQLDKLRTLFDEVYISAKENKFDFDCRVIQDNYQESSPLVGLISVFETLQAEEIFILSVDAPFVGKEIIEKLLEQNESQFDVIVAQSPSGVQPLCGLYKRSVLPLAYTQLEKGNHRLGDLLRLANTHLVAFNEDGPFTNLNHPEEYQQALKRFKNH
ncbi:molybdenum cofactor guanylyltransferase MobA [Sulfurovum sp. XTW-4]|uniref:Probable molybdenum cofactor guanylyltransferase n=1 Tax=Sulfurovum xiamenensis TaxID=3019066 RepID=A0ABT7QSF4_9BACT|nr:molybdenum cofactor guanylyltransferase MobA [Sulfurovum xiamenensis]MDM5264017.1 molybdenum cofactor guanylyltransferase MobA [Sulfurovum xiamenensis]